jgi:predicted Zn-dependent peptidase
MSRILASIPPSRLWRLGATSLLTLAALATPGWEPDASAQSLAAFEARTTVHVLPNGWTFIICERPGAPVFSFATQADVGAAQDPKGMTGLAHMSEHMAFKGTRVIGTTDWAKEGPALEKMDAAYMAWQKAKDARGADPKEVDKLKTAFEAAQADAQQYVKPNEFDELVSREGGVGMNAGTSSDATTYYYSLPANKFELFAYLESERFSKPVFREFYKERDVVIEERRLRTESQPTGRLIERFIAAAFVAHPYSNAPIGHRSDLERYTMNDSMAFFDKYYAPSNLVTSIVGGIKAKEIIPVIDKYFGRIAARPKPEPLRTIEPAGGAETVVTLRDPAQPIYIEGYHKPAATDPSEPAFDAITDVLTRGRTSRLYRLLVRDKQLAIAIQGGGSFPGAKYPHLMVLFAVPARGIKTEQVVEALRPELERLKTEDITDEEMARFKTRAKADLIRSLDSNEGLAENLANYQTLFGDWRELFRYVERLDKVTKADVRKAAAATFVDANRTVAKIETAAAPASASPSGAAR